MASLASRIASNGLAVRTYAACETCLQQVTHDHTLPGSRLPLGITVQAAQVVVQPR